MAAEKRRLGARELKNYFCYTLRFLPSQRLGSVAWGVAYRCEMTPLLQGDWPLSGEVSPARRRFLSAESSWLGFASAPSFSARGRVSCIL